MSVFEQYAQYYDAFYNDKNYEQEAEFVKGLIRKHHSSVKHILELGCGTGLHALSLAASGFFVLGIDFSQIMIEEARRRSLDAATGLKNRLRFEQADIRRYKTNKKFDAIISLFHVMSYQTTNDDLRAAFSTAKAHLRPGGLFIFDCWYGPTVLTERPSKREKKVTKDHLSITRIAEPALQINDNIVDVHYHFTISNNLDREIKNLSETHRMRYFFKPEVELLLSETGFECLQVGEWLSRRPPGTDTWSVYFVGRKL